MWTVSHDPVCLPSMGTPARGSEPSIQFGKSQNAQVEKLKS